MSGPERMLRFLLLCGKPGRWIAHRLGWLEWIEETMTRNVHLGDCSSDERVSSPRPHGWIKHCKGCGAPMVLHFGCWEVEGGFMPPEVVKWIAEELSALCRP